MKSKKYTSAIVFGILIFLAALIGQPTAHGYLHPADPLILLAAVLLPLPQSMVAAGLAGLLADLAKGYYLLSPFTLIIKLLMVLAVKGLLKTKSAQKHPELMVSVAALIPVPGYYLAELLYQLITGNGASSFANAAVTLQKNTVQAAAGVLLFILLYDLYKGIKAGTEAVRRQEEEKAALEKEESAE